MPTKKPEAPIVLQETAAQAIGLLANASFGKQKPAQRDFVKQNLTSYLGLVSGGLCESTSLKGKMPAHSRLGGDTLKYFGGLHRPR